MGFISNQWLNRGQGLRSRRNDPVSVIIIAENPTGTWSRRNEIAVEFTAWGPNDQYQTLHLTALEADKAAEIILNACSEGTRKRVAGEMLAKLPDVELHKILADIFKSRVDNAK